VFFTDVVSAFTASRQFTRLRRSKRRKNERRS
jgi:hypothetical protein